MQTTYIIQCTTMYICSGIMSNPQPYIQSFFYPLDREYCEKDNTRTPYAIITAHCTAHVYVCDSKLSSFACSKLTV